MATGENTYQESDGKSVQVALTSTVAKGKVTYADGFLGIALADGISGQNVNLNIDDREYQFTVPSGLSVAKGQVVYVDVTSLTGHYPNDAAYSTSAGSNKIRLFKATAAKDGNNVVTGILLVGKYLS